MSIFYFFIRNKKCSQISLSITEENLFTADSNELGPSVTTNLFDCVWTKNEKLTFSPPTDCLVVLKQFLTVFWKWFHFDIRQCWIVEKRQLLHVAVPGGSWKARYRALQVLSWKFFQVCLAVFPTEDAITLYKVKISAIYQLKEKNSETKSWHHPIEATGKSDQHSKKEFYSKTMMGGGRLHHQDPTFLQLNFRFCRVLKTLEPEFEELGYTGKENLLQDCYGILHPGTTTPVISNTSIISNEPKQPKLAVGQTRPTVLRPSRMRFLLLGTFPGTTQLEIERNNDQ